MSVSSIGAYTGVSPFSLGGYNQGNQAQVVRPTLSISDASEDVRRTVRDTAQMIVDKLSGQATVGENGGQNGEALADSLASTAEWMNEKYGAKAGTAVLGILAGYVGNGNVGEEALSKGMLAAIRFTDRNYGISAGDALASRLNSDLNVKVNDYFDNGLSEQIYTSTVAANDVSRTLSVATLRPGRGRLGPADAAGLPEGRNGTARQPEGNRFVFRREVRTGRERSRRDRWRGACGRRNDHPCAQGYSSRHLGLIRQAAEGDSGSAYSPAHCARAAKSWLMASSRAASSSTSTISTRSSPSMRKSLTVPESKTKAVSSMIT